MIHEQGWQVLVRFDDQSAALIEKQLGDGRVWVLTTGWQPSESQLAVSSKFVPIVAGMFDPSASSEQMQLDFQPGQTVSLPGQDGPVKIKLPNDEIAQLDEAPFDFQETSETGIYEYSRPELSGEFAVNLPPSESQTEPLDVAVLERSGLPPI